MGLFDKKECMLCGKSAGLFGTKLADGYICSNCDIDLMPKFLKERVDSKIDGFTLKYYSLEQVQDCAEHFNNGNLLKRTTKNLPKYLGSFAVDREKREVEIDGKKGVYRVPIEYLDTIIYDCYEAKNNNKPKFVFVILSDKCAWLNGYVFEGVFKNDGLFRFTSAKKAREHVRKIAEEIEVNMIPFDEYKKIMKKAQRKEQLEMVKSIFSKI